MFRLASGIPPYAFSPPAHRALLCLIVGGDAVFDLSEPGFDGHEFLALDLFGSKEIIVRLDGGLIGRRNVVDHEAVISDEGISFFLGGGVVQVAPLEDALVVSSSGDEVLGVVGKADGGHVGRVSSVDVEAGPYFFPAKTYARPDRGT